jgi:hypothetical protein
VVPAASGAAGVNVAVLVAALYEREPATAGPAAAASAMATVPGWTATLKVADTGAVVATPVALAAGARAVTVGAAAAGAVVKDQEAGAAIGVPEVDVAPLTVTV